MNPLNYFPKTIDVAEYVSKVDIPEIYYGRKAYLTLTPKFRTDEFRLSYTMYGDEGGAIAYLPFREEDIKEAEEKGFFVGTFNGGFVGNDVDLLVEHMGRWLTENKFM